MNKRWNVVIIVIIGLLLIGGAGIGWKQLASTPETATLKPPATQAGAQKPKEAMVRLPGATPIAALNEDYDTPESIWVVVSKKYPLADQAYRPADLTLTDLPVRSDKSNDEKSIRAVVVPALTNMFDDAKAAGHSIMIASAFRSYALQQAYFTSYSNAYGVDKANTFSARPGESEHQTGLALDIAYQDRNCYLDICFGETAAGKWLAANAYKYGFVLRYPSDKTTLTQYQYEPWHFRYVGKPLALALHQSGLTLDEVRPYLQTARDQLKAQHKI